MAKNKKLKGMHDSGKRQQFKTGAVRDTAEDKPRPELISPWAIVRIGHWLKLGAKKYGEGNWQRGMPFMRVIASLTRHTIAYMLGKKKEDHLAAVATNAIFLMHYEEMIKLGLLPADLDDRDKYFAVDWSKVTEGRCNKYLRQFRRKAKK